MMNHEIEVEPARSISPVEDSSPDSRVAAAQFEAIIRAWKGEAVDQAVPTSPVGEVDWDGGLAAMQLGMNDPVMFSCTFYTLWSLIGCTWDCSPIDCSDIYGTCDPNNCQVA